MIEISRSNSPVVLGLPHTGVGVPQSIMERFNDCGKALADTDWNIHQLYDGLADVTSVRTKMHRYVIDVNRAPEDESLYPGQNTTGLCPVTDFDGQKIYQDGEEPNADEIAQRLAKYHTPYHSALREELERIHAIHGFVILYDCHSIRSNIPFLFDGTLPDFNVGTNSGTSCDKAIEKAVYEICENAKGYSSVLNGRFKGGWTTRHYGKPNSGYHAIQMESAQSTYMSETAPWTYSEKRAAQTRSHLKHILETLTTWRPQ